MKSNKEFYENLYINKLNWLFLAVMLFVSIFTFSNFAMFLLYGVLLIALTLIGFKQYIFDIVALIVVMVMSALQYSVNLGLITNVGQSFGIISIVCVGLTLANFFLVRYNYKVFVLNLSGSSDSKEKTIVAKPESLNEKTKENN